MLRNSPSKVWRIMTNLHQVKPEDEDTWIYLAPSLEITSMKKGTFYYYVRKGIVRSMEGENERDHTYNLADIKRLTAKRRAKKKRSPSHTTYEWLTSKDMSSIVDLDMRVFEWSIVGDINLYVSWVKRNPRIAICAFDKRNHRSCLAYVSMLPLPESLILDIMLGKRDEMDIKAEEIETYEREGEYTLLANSVVVQPDKMAVLYGLIETLMHFWVDQYPQRYISKIYAQSASPGGNILIQKLYFAPLYQIIGNQALPAQNAYVLDLTRPGASLTIRRFQEELKVKQSNQGLPAVPSTSFPIIPLDKDQ